MYNIWITPQVSLVFKSKLPFDCILPRSSFYLLLFIYVHGRFQTKDNLFLFLTTATLCFLVVWKKDAVRGGFTLARCSVRIQGFKTHRKVRMNLNPEDFFFFYIYLIIMGCVNHADLPDASIWFYCNAARPETSELCSGTDAFYNSIFKPDIKKDYLEQVLYSTINLPGIKSWIFLQ